MARRRTFAAMVLVAVAVLSGSGALLAQESTPTPDSITVWIEELDSDDPAARAQAAMSLGNAGASEAVPALLNHLDDPDPTAGYRIAVALGQIADPESIIPLIRFLRQPGGTRQTRAAKALGLMRAGQAVPNLSFLLSSDDSLVVSAAAEALGLIGTSDAFGALANRSRDDLWTSRRQAATQALEKAGEEAVPALLNALEYGKEVQRRNVAELLGYIGDRSSVRGLIYALSDSSPAVRAEAARALGRIGDPTAVSHLRKLWRRENNPTVRRQASLAITHLLTGGGGSSHAGRCVTCGQDDDGPCCAPVNGKHVGAGVCMRRATKFACQGGGKVMPVQRFVQT